MAGMDKISSAIKAYEAKNDTDYEKLLISDNFYEQLHKEAAEKVSKNSFKKVSSSIIDFPRMEIVKNANYDFKLI